MEDISGFLLVEWTEERKFSVVKRDAIVDLDEKQKKDTDLVGRHIMINWRAKAYNALIIQCGKLI